MFNRTQIDDLVLETVKENTHVDQAKVRMDSNLNKDLAMSDFDSFGLLIDLDSKFQLGFCREM